MYTRTSTHHYVSRLQELGFNPGSSVQYLPEGKLSSWAQRRGVCSMVEELMEENTQLQSFHHQLVLV